MTATYYYEDRGCPAPFYFFRHKDDVGIGVGIEVPESLELHETNQHGWIIVPGNWLVLVVSCWDDSGIVRPPPPAH